MRMKPRHLCLSVLAVLCTAAGAAQPGAQLDRVLPRFDHVELEQFVSASSQFLDKPVHVYAGLKGAVTLRRDSALTRAQFSEAFKRAVFEAGFAVLESKDRIVIAPRSAVNPGA
jgi:type II secretory pathway component GspD/PulD (secretin)